MHNYPFQLIQYERKGPLEDNSLLAERPFAKADPSFEADTR